MASSNSSTGGSTLRTVGSIMVVLAVVYVIFQVLGFVFDVIIYVAPLLFIASLVIDHQVFLGFLGMLKRLFQRNWIYGVAAGIASVVFFPIVALYLLGMALFKKKVKDRRREMDEQVNGKWVDFEDVSEKPLDLDTPYEELPPAPQPSASRRGKDTGYDELFD
ncbi:hypothetical protein [Neolewinella antarctica]|uniref:Multisubunit Na+/H+ antiporter MnhG subunit n=1 Tax=Neolewinella antarctica TaxID=442734 RepID=A0ABX0X6W0_9BACT|nr:hypothetical protein [Neolewinella antarctica]NJC24960.1 multisubunit Na+/H+ antiporter MnhG subunit [Neolewinella antarctica]